MRQPQPADDDLGALTQVHDQHPDNHDPLAHQGIQIPDPEWEEQDVKEFVVQLHSKVVELPVAEVGQLALLVCQQVAVAAKAGPSLIASLHTFGGAATPRLVGILIAVALTGFEPPEAPGCYSRLWRGAPPPPPPLGQRRLR